MPEPEFKATPKTREQLFHDRFENAYIGFPKRDFEKQLVELTDELESEMAKPANKDFLPGHYLQAVLFHEKFNLLKYKQTNFVQKQAHKKFKNKKWQDLSLEDLRGISEQFPENEQMKELLDQTIDKYRKSIEKPWVLSKFSNSVSASIFLADLLYQKSVSVKDQKEKDELKKQADDLLKKAATSSNIESGIKTEYKLMYIIRKTIEKYADTEDISIEHGLLREDNGQEKADLKITIDNLTHKLQMATTMDPHPSDEKRNRIKAEKMQSVPRSTTVFVISKRLINQAFEQAVFNRLNRTSARKVIDEVAQDIFPPDLAKDFTLKVVPLMEVKAETQKLLSKKTAENYTGPILTMLGIEPTTDIGKFMALKKKLTTFLLKYRPRLKVDQVINPSSELLKKIKDNFKI